MSANNFPMKVLGFKDLGQRILNTEENKPNFHYVPEFPNSHQELKFRFLPLLFLHDQEPMYFRNQIRDYLSLYAKMLRLDARSIILTSERNSPELDAFCRYFGSIPCFWFSNALLASEWYAADRFRLVDKHTKLRYKFSCLNRLISHGREYRLVISAHLLNSVDHAHLQLSCSTIDPSTGIKSTQLKKFLSSDHAALVGILDGRSTPVSININHNDISSSVIKNASFNTNREYFDETFCHIVTETTFNDTLHLTEKSLRPFVNRRPFILAAAAGSLKTLREYGFKTFNDFWSEDYDDITDNSKRLSAILQLISEINAMPLSKMEKMLANMQPILDYNRSHFYDKLPSIAVNELKNNLISAAKECRKQTAKGYHLKALERLSDDEYLYMLRNDIEDNFGSIIDTISNLNTKELNLRSIRGIQELQGLGIDLKGGKEMLVSTLQSMFNN